MILQKKVFVYKIKKKKKKKKRDRSRLHFGGEKGLNKRVSL
jgi:hypothetical protein